MNHSPVNSSHSGSTPLACLTSLVPAWCEELRSGTLALTPRAAGWFPYTVRVSRRVRGARLSIGPATGLVITVPPGAGPDDVDRVIRRHQGWIARQFERLAQVARQVPRRWPYGATLPYLGQEYRVMVQPAGAQTGVQLQPSEQLLLVSVPRLTVGCARRALTQWYGQQALHWGTQQATHWAQVLGVTYQRLSIRDQRSRWGSCSASGAVSLNYRLVMAPLSVLNYVVIHELAHVRQLNHSRRFWDLVARHCPTYRDAIAWLKAYGPTLTLA